MKEAQRYFELAQDYWKREDFKGALPHMRQAVKLNPEEPEYRLRLGELLLSLNRPDSAVIQLREGVKVSPQNQKIRLLLGNAYLSLEQLNEAEIEFQEAIRLNPEEGLALAGIATVYLKREDWDTAIEKYQSANRLTPKNPEILWGLSVSYLKKKDYTSARKTLIAVSRCGDKDRWAKVAKDELRKLAGREELPSEKNESAEAIFETAKALLRERNIEPALAKLRKAIRLDSKNPEYRVEYGLALADQGQMEEAVLQLKKAVSLRTTDVRAYIKLGEIYLKNGLTEMALLALQNAEFLDSGNPLIKDLLKIAHQNQVLEDGRESELFIRFVKEHFPVIWTEYRKPDELKPEEFRKVQLEGEADSGQIDATVKVLRRKGLIDYARYEDAKFLIRLKAPWPEFIRAVCSEIPQTMQEEVKNFIPQLKYLHKDFNIGEDTLIIRGTRKVLSKSQREKLEKRLVELMPSIISDEKLSDAVLLSIFSFSKDKDTDNPFLNSLLP